MNNLISSRTKRNKRSRFIKRIAVLIEYFKENGSIANIKQTDTYKFEDVDVKIGYLISNLRRDKKEGRLSQEDISLLDYLGMDWGDSFEKFIDKLMPYYLKYGSLESLTQYHEELGYLLTYLRVMYRENGLTIKEISKLEEMGIVWSPNNINTVLVALRAYYYLNGSIADIQLKDSMVINDKTYNIGKQIAHFRNKRNSGKLSQDYIDALDAIGMDWGKKFNKKLKENNEREF